VVFINGANRMSIDIPGNTTVVPRSIWLAIIGIYSKVIEASADKYTKASKLMPKLLKVLAVKSAEIQQKNQRQITKPLPIALFVLNSASENWVNRWASLQRIKVKQYSV
jgi:hypothetical protein